MANFEEFTWETIKMLRAEISYLKGCQVQYFSLAVTATSAILGLAATLTAPGVRGLGMLAPLGLLLPCWVIFFDKATTITRTVGYQRALEELLVPPTSTHFFWFIAFETALGKFRQAQDEGRLNVDTSPHNPNILRVLLLHTRHRYWMLNWYTFFVLSLLCCILGYNFLGDKIFDFRLPLGIYAEVPERTLWGGPAFFLVIVVAVYTFLVAVQLICGKHSYEANTKAWKLLKRIGEIDS